MSEPVVATSTFDQVATLRPGAPGVLHARIGPDWAQGRTLFGGLTGALAAEAALRAVAADGQPRPLRSLDVTFLAPLPPGELTLQATVLAQGRSVSTVGVDVRAADGTLGLRATVIAGLARASAIRVPAPAPDPAVPTGPPHEQGVQVPFIPGLSPAFLQHLDLRLISRMPFSGTGPHDAAMTGWVRHATAAHGLAATLALVDAPAPTVLPMFTAAGNASTIRWSAHVVGELPTDAGQDWFWTHGRAVQAADGYAVEQSYLYRDGELLVWSEQIVAVFDPQPVAD